MAVSRGETLFLVTLARPGRRIDEVTMSEFFKSGGFPMFFVLALGLIGFGGAVFFAFRPDPRRVDAIRSLMRATLYCSVVGIMTDIAAVCSHIPANPEWANSPKIHLVVMEGISESMAPGILGFSLLAMTWLVMAVGHRRLGRELPV